MQHKFKSLIELVVTWESLSNDDFVELVKHFLEIDSLGLYKKAIISAIFEQLYDDGDSNDYLFFADLLTFSQGLQQLESNFTHEKECVGSKFEKLPETLLCQIASYLPAKNIFSKWNRVNRKFVQIGLKPESVKYLQFYSGALTSVN